MGGWQDGAHTDTGGTGETGSWFARYFREKGWEVAVWGPSGRVEVAERLGCTMPMI